MSPTTPPDPHLTALLAAAYRLGLAAGQHGIGGGAVSSGIGVPQSGAQFPVPPPGGASGAPSATPMDHHEGATGVGGAGVDGVSLAQLATQQNIAATLRDDAMRDALSRSEQRRQTLEIARWAQLASMRGTPTRSWMTDTSGLPFRG